jgi:hypothetical protein
MAIGKVKKIEGVAASLGVSPRTVRRWMDKGCDIDNPALIEEFKNSAEARSKGWIRKRAMERRRSNQDGREYRQDAPGTREGEELDNLPPAGDEGAVAALKRLQRFETLFARRLDRALQLNKAHLIQTARDDHAKIAATLLRYEREVEESKRDLGHLIAKGEAERGARAAAIWFRLAWRLWLSSSLPDILAMSDNLREAKHKAEITFAEILDVALKNAKESAFTMPDWADAVIREEFHHEI